MYYDRDISGNSIPSHAIEETTFAGCLLLEELWVFSTLAIIIITFD
jgi:hypothetical protein